ncbi:stalk domain-containing protein [Aminipila luticellarii]|uniref:Copper amine oxidase-like N-terminal domain-containing protein n=1 Tax=Aminipila luticellarii TaxID=2507160 RepID=A0A410PXD1_9FIRM|nr:stalk domain-containing protein [Aminipila luticellarii]QAT43627.1 hypothetical protein EQM06_10575 [Aminipila luticellarii]
MKKQCKGFIMGFILACLLVIPTTALADNIQAQFNAANITVNGKDAVKLGENYQLSDGSIVPFSINYKGTTYIPIRKVSELLGIGIDYDNTTKTVQITTSSKGETGTQPAESENTSTSSAVTYTTSYCVFNECDKDANVNGDKMAHVIGYKDGKTMNILIDYSYYNAISAKIESPQLWQAKVDQQGNMTKVNAVSASKSGKVESSDSRSSVTLSSGKYDLEKTVVMYQWTEDKAYRVYSGNLKQDDYVNLYDTDGDKAYDIVLLNRDGKTIPAGDSTTSDTSSNTGNNQSGSSKTDTKTASTGYSVLNECWKSSNDDGNTVQKIVGFIDGKKMDTLTNDKSTVQDWSAPKLSSNGFSNTAVYKISLNSQYTALSADKIKADVQQGVTESANARSSVVIGGKTYQISSNAVMYKVTSDEEYKVFTGNLKQGDIVELYETDSSKDGYDIVILSRE